MNTNRGLVAQTGYIPEGLQLIRDTWTFKVLKEEKIIAESINGKERPALRITGLFQEGDKENANGRVYPMSVLAEAVHQIQADISRRAVLGEYDHPPDAKIHLDRISHLISKVWIEGKRVFGEAEILDSQPFGAQLRGLFESKVQVGISSRGIGDMTVREQNGQEIAYVEPGYSFVTWDAVAEPSVAGAVLNLAESRMRSMKKAVNAGIVSKESYQEALCEAILKEFGLKRF